MNRIVDESPAKEAEPTHVQKPFLVEGQYSVNVGGANVNLSVEAGNVISSADSAWNGFFDAN